MSWRKSKQTAVTPIDAPAVSQASDAAPGSTGTVATPDELPGNTGRVRGERGIPSVNRASSVQARITRVLTVGLGAVLVTLGSAWYVKANVDRVSQPAAAARASAKAKAAGDMPVPPLGPMTMPVFRKSPATDDTNNAADDEGGDVPSSPLATVLGDRPDPPNWRDYAPAEEAAAPASGSARAMAVTPAVTPPVDRRLQGSVFASGSGTSFGGGDALGSGPLSDGSELPPPSASTSSVAAASLIGTGVARATRLPTRRWWLPKGTFLDCTLETAIDSTLPGLVTGVLASDTYGADGQVVLLERGTRLLGEVSGSVTRGQRRMRVIWQEARTPTGVVIQLESPGTDALGRAGVTGEVDRHFGERFGAAMLVSVLDGAVQAAIAAQRDNSGNAVVVSPSGAQDIATEVLKDTVAIPPTIRVAPGERLQVLVAKDVDFRGVYGLERRRP
jgi:type IV secretion system protein VirB10